MFGQQLQPEIKREVDRAGANPIEFTNLLPELDAVESWSKTCLVSVAVVEKLHKTNGDLSTARGKAKARDVQMVQAGFELGLLKKLGDWRTRMGCCTQCRRPPWWR